MNFLQYFEKVCNKLWVALPLLSNSLWTRPPSFNCFLCVQMTCNNGSYRVSHCLVDGSIPSTTQTECSHLLFIWSFFRKIQLSPSSSHFQKSNCVIWKLTFYSASPSFSIARSLFQTGLVGRFFCQIHTFPNQLIATSRFLIKSQKHQREDLGNSEQLSANRLIITSLQLSCSVISQKRNRLPKTFAINLKRKKMYLF